MSGNRRWATREPIKKKFGAKDCVINDVREGETNPFLFFLFFLTIPSKMGGKP